jgi:peroxiredoxin
LITMDMLLIASRLLLSAVFAVAGVAKLLDLEGSQRAMREFGLPTSWANILGYLLPLAELAIALALLPAATAWWGALGALTLLLLFVAAIGFNLARGRKPDCHCFGQLHSAPVGWRTLARNGLLAAVAGFVIWQGPGNAGSSALAWLGNLTAGQLAVLILGAVGLAALIAEGWFLLHLLRQHGRLLLRIEELEARLTVGGVAPTQPAPTPTFGLPVGAAAPSFQLAGINGQTLTLDMLRASGKLVMLIFSDPGCGPCNALLPDVARWQSDHADKLTIALISRGTPEANRTKIAEHGLTHVLLQRDREVAQAYQAHGTPTAVIVRPDGTIASDMAAGAEAIGQLVMRTVGAPAPAMLPTAPGRHDNNGHAVPAMPLSLKIGEPAPALKLPDLTGKSIDLEASRGHMTLLLFWNPGCGFCQRMLDELKAWEASPPQGAPQLLVVSTGTVEANRAQGLRSPVVLDQNFTVGRMFGANGTPMAILVDAEGRVASEVVAGAPAVMELANNSVHVAT